MVQQNTVNQA